MDRSQRIKEYRDKKISELANFIASDFFENNQTDLHKILTDERITLYYDHYENYFDGLLVHEPYRFYIHLNIDKGNKKDSKRSRFSIAHELGHYFIPEHHQSIINGTFQCHPSNFRTYQSNLIEQEADYFAACLLMPSVKFKEACYRKKFSLNLIDEISNKFNVSRLSALQRFIDVDAGTYPIMISFYRNGLLSGFKQSKDFPYRNIPFKSKIGQPPPPISAIGEYYRKNDAKYTDVQTIYTDDWFWVDYSKKLSEQCFYSDYGYDISILWPE